MNLSEELLPAKKKLSFNIIDSSLIVENNNSTR